MSRKKIGLRDLIGDIEEELEKIEEEDFQEEDLPEERMRNKGLTEEEIRAKWKKKKWEEDVYGLKDLACVILCWIPAIILIIIGIVIFFYSSLS